MNKIDDTTVGELLKSEYETCGICQYDMIKNEFNYCPICGMRV